MTIKRKKERKCNGIKRKVGGKLKYKIIMLDIYNNYIQPWKNLNGRTHYNLYAHMHLPHSLFLPTLFLIKLLFKHKSNLYIFGFFNLYNICFTDYTPTCYIIIIIIMYYT